MGYRSEVGLCLSAKARELMTKELAELSTTDTEKSRSVVELLAEATVREDKETGVIAYYWDWLKWYPDFQEVSFFENFMRTLEEKDRHDDYYFIRLGEESDDNEFNGGFWDNPFDMSIVRYINFEDDGNNSSLGMNIPPQS